ncbi:12679_t:CDS:1 [Funneliformis geosporum]|uniref:12679_t:CDS:1 n=1 Tax=Funneliformis geosporum TaxID=1117311 RepID=A0A9W4WX14_9GLOM|nr:12679_t:CDS:1 [Funneliformis geosporum]
MKINNNKIKSLFLLSLVGSGLAKEENAKNQTEILSDGINLNSLPQMATNLTKRENDPDKTLIFAGYPISLGVGTVGGNFNRYCTASFIIENSDSHQAVISTFCMPDEHCAGTMNKYVVSWDGLINLGSAPLYFTIGDNSLHDYTTIEYNLDNVEPIPYVVGDNNHFYPVVGYAQLPAVGDKACAYGAVSGYLCGKFSQQPLDSYLTIPEPCSKVNMNDQTLNTKIVAPLLAVELGVNGFYAQEDIGGPVYTVSNIGDQTVA